MRQEATLRRRMHRPTAEGSFRSPGARGNRAARPRRSEWSRGARFGSPGARVPAPGQSGRASRPSAILRGMPILFDQVAHTISPEAFDEAAALIAGRVHRTPLLTSRTAARVVELSYTHLTLPTIYSV